ncbi:hypothetical protein DL93DRAFT_454886 [Clavulina sp. PMI_390]|nr:hypothetical protein DL93DRAFT_454886 [Clavulina sp. PMI_390]
MRSFFILSTLSMSLAALAAPLRANVKSPIRRQSASSNTVTALQFAHVLEQLETQFYGQALKKFTASDLSSAGFNNPQLAVDILTGIQNDEATHTTVLEAALTAVGATPISSCNFDFTSALTDVKTTINVARLVENVGVSAYLGATTLIDDAQLLTDAASIATIESRHQTIHNLLAGGSPIATSFDIALSPSQVLAIAGPFISGCDVGIPANAPLSVTNTGPIGVGTKLDFSSTALNSSTITANTTCQMMVGGAFDSIALPLDNCVVPSGINGLVYVYVTHTQQPLLNDLTVQFGADVIAGPLGVFIDTQDSLIADLITSGPIGGNPQFVAANPGSSGGGNTNTGTTTTTSDGSTTTSAPTTTSTDTSGGSGGSTFTVSSTIPASLTSSFIAGLSTSAATPTATPGAANVLSGPNFATGTIGGGGVVVIGWSSVAAPTATPTSAKRSVGRRNAGMRRL